MAVGLRRIKTAVTRTRLFAGAFTLSLMVVLVSAQQALGQERLCDTAFEDCRQPLWTLIDNETVGIDVSFWFIQDTSLSNKIIARFQAGVPVRVLCDPRASATYAGNQEILDQLRAAGIPMRYKVADCILHRKFMLFAGQAQVEFSGANYGPFFFVPSVPYQDYIDEAIYFTSDTSVLNSFKTIMDDMWTDTMNYGNYANITGPLTRRYPVFPIDPELNFPPSTDGSDSFFNRSLNAFNLETQKIDVIMYRITNLGFTNMTIDAVNRGIPVRLLTEQNEYRNRDRPWDSYNVDLLYNAGVQIRIRGHEGLSHEKVAMLYGQGLTVFGSSNWTGPSANCQAENNYFTTKPWFFNWFVNHFERKWNSTSETQPFTPLPPDQPSYQSPPNNATGRPTNVTLSWEGGPYAHKFDIYFGTNPNPPLLAADRFIGSVDNSVAETFTPPTLQSGTKYYWRIVSKTMANMTASGPIWSFTTAGTPGPAPTVSSISPNSGSTSGGTAVTITGTNFLAGATVSIGGAAATGVNVTSSTTINAVTPAHAAGTVSVTVTNTDGQSGTLANSFTYTTAPPPPPPGTGEVVLYAAEAPVRIGNWNVVSDSSAAGGARLFNPDAGAPKLTDALPNPTSYFEATFQAQSGTAYRLWIRGKAQSDFWGNDSVFAQFSDSLDGNGGTPVYRIGTTSGTAINLEDCTGCGVQGWGWQDNGWGSGVMGPLIYFAGTGTHTIRIQVREDGLSIDQIVLSPGTYLNTAPGALKNDSTILAKSGGGGGTGAPTVSSISPNTGGATGGTSVTISGTNFVSGATVTLGGAVATNINVANATTITAVTPAHAAGTVNVVVSNPDGQTGTLTGGFTYTTAPPAPAPAVTGVSPNSGSTAGGASVTITGTNFVTGASVTFGGTAASSVNVTSGTSITAVTPAHAAGAVAVTVANPDGQTGSLAGGYTYIGGEIVLLADDFNDNSIDASKWNDSSLFSGFTDTSLPIAEVNQRLEIGPLLQGTGGSHYAGIRSASVYDFTNAYCYVQIIQPASSATSADAMFTIGGDVNNYYRIFLEGSSLMFQKRIGGTKFTLMTAAFSPSNDRFWRIRHESATSKVFFETAPDAGGAPGSWTVRYNEPWNAAIPLGAMLFEIKGGTWQSEANQPGKVIFDNFRAAKQ